MGRLFFYILLSIVCKVSSITEDEDLLITDLDGDSPIDFEVIDEGDEDELEDLEDWTESAVDNMEEAVLLPDFPVTDDLEDEIEYYELEFSDLEEFETVEIDGVVYNPETLMEKIKEMKDFLEILELDEELKELEEATEYLDNSKSPEQFELSLDEAMEVAESMNSEIVIEINGTIFTSERLIEIIEETLVAQDANLETQIAAEVSIVEGNTLEDLLEEQADLLSSLVNIMEPGDNVLIEDVTYSIEELEYWLKDNLNQVIDMDSLDDLASDINDVDLQFSIENLSNDDNIDEIEEIKELLDLTEEDPILIGSISYSVEELQEIVEEDKESSEQFLIIMELEDIDDLFVDFGSDSELDLDDQMNGLEELQELIEIMDVDDIVVLDGIEFDKTSLEDQLDQAYINIDNQREKKLGEVLTGIDLVTVTRKELDGLIESAEQLISVMEIGEIVVIDDINCTLEDVELLLQSLLDKEKKFAKENEILDIEHLFSSFEMEMISPDFQNLQLEIKELVHELEEGDVVSYGEEVYDSTGLLEFKEDVAIVENELIGLFLGTDSDIKELFQEFDLSMDVGDFDELGDLLQTIIDGDQELINIGMESLNEAEFQHLIESVDVMGDELGEESDLLVVETETTGFLALI